jgi:7-carboxy-7-deazaguanine synthase
MDIKCPESGMERFNYLKNTELLKPDDELKFVLSSEADYEWAKEIIYRLNLADKCKILMSPIEKTMTSRQLAELILRDKLGVRLNLQLHKLIWGDDENEH